MENTGSRRGRRVTTSRSPLLRHVPASSRAGSPSGSARVRRSVNRLSQVSFGSRCRLCLPLRFGNKALLSARSARLHRGVGFFCFPKRAKQSPWASFDKKEEQLLLPDVQAHCLQEAAPVPAGAGKLESLGDRPQTRWRRSALAISIPAWVSDGHRR